jgi:flagellar assembly protein FliH
LYNKIFKNYQVNVGIPFQVKAPINFDTIKKMNTAVKEENEETEEKGDFHQHTEDHTQELIQRAQEDADAIIKEAEFEALRLMEDAQREVEEIRLVVEEEARRKGYEEGFDEAKKQYEDLIQEAEFIRGHARAEYKEVLEGMESDAINVILDIARKVIGIEISVNREDVLYLVKKAFEKCSNKENVVLKVSPEDYEFLNGARDKLLAMIEGAGELEIKKDSSLKLGACIIDTPFGSIAAGVDTKLKKIEEAFRRVIGK